MRKFIIATLAVSVLATSVPAIAVADPGDGRAWYDVKERRDDRGRKDHRDNRREDRGYFEDARRHDNRRHDNRRYDGHRYDDRRTVVIRNGPQRQVTHYVWRKGDRFDHRRAPRYVVINNPRHYHLHEAPRGYRWVRSGNDAVLVGITSGIVAAVVTSVLIN